MMRVQSQKQKGKFGVIKQPEQHLLDASYEQQVIKRIESKQDLILSRLDKSHLQNVLAQILDERLTEIMKTMHEVLKSLDIINGRSNLEQKTNSELEISNEHYPEEKNYEKDNKELPYEYSQFQPDYEDQYQKFKRQVQFQDGNNELSAINIMNQHVYQPSQFFDNSSLLLQYLNDKFEEMSLKFTSCKLVYEYDLLKEINFHQRIDNKNNLFFMAELQNNEIIGAFTHLGFDPQPNYIPKENPKSFICNLNKNVFVYAYKINRTHTYDKNFLIFGNWEIKVKAGDDVLETNWGGNGDCFLRKQYGKDEKTTVKLQWLFGNGAGRKLIKMKQYQIYIFS